MFNMGDSISQRLSALWRRIGKAEQTAGRAPRSVRLVVVSEKQSVNAMREAVNLGLRDFGESDVQEAQEKMATLAGLDLSWHFIGPIQANQTAAIAERFNWAHSVDRAEIAQRLNDQRPEGMAPLNVCIQVNISGDAGTSGVAPEEVVDLARSVLALPRVRLRGLMCIPAASEDSDARRQSFKRLRELLETARRETRPHLETLSMGMSDDLEEAIAEGATMVRVGRDIFGSGEA